MSVTGQSGSADVALVDVRIEQTDPGQALAGLAAAPRLAGPARAETAEQLYTAEREMLEGCRMIPIAHLPEAYGVGPRVRGGPGIAPSGEWRFENVWLERP